MGHSSFLFSTGAWDQVLVKYWTWPCRGRFLVLAIGEESSLGPFLVLVIGEESSLGPFLVLVIGEESSLGASRFWPFKKTQVLVLDWKMEYQVLAMYVYYTFYIEKYNPKHIIYKVKSLCSYLTVEKRQTYNLIDWFFLPAETFQIQMDPLLSSINYLSLRKYIIEFSYFGLLPLSLQDYRLAVLLLLHWPTVSKSLNYNWAQVLLGVSCIFQSNGRIYLFKISATYGLQSRYPIFPQKSTYTEYTFFLNWKKNRSRYPICTLCWGSR